MEFIFFGAIILLLLGGFLYLAKVIRDSQPKKEDGQQSLLFLSELSRNIDSKLSESRQESQKLLNELNKQMQQSLVDVAKEQTKTNEATKQFLIVAEQLSNLEKVLKHQKQRGNLGEASLELILSNMLPPEGFKMQHEFKDGKVVDAVIHTKEGMVPVDAKFSLDNYNRVLSAIDDRQREELEKEFKNDLKKRIDETAKYIRPQEGTLPFAFMFIPAEAIFYDLLVNEVGAIKVNTRNLIDYALNDKKVCIVSPTTFAAYLHSVLYGFKAFRIEKQAIEIIKKIDELSKHMSAYQEYHNKLGVSLKTTFNHYAASTKEFKKIDKDVTRITGSEMSMEPLVLEAPVFEEE